MNATATKTRKRPEFHGHARNGKSLTYRSWQQMIRRCHDPRSRTYPRYGAKGVTVCERWRQSFRAFLADAGERPSRFHSIDRFPNRSGNYEPGNVRWATATEQARNAKSNRLVTLDGRTLTLAAWCEEFGLNYFTVVSRLNAGWTPKRAFTTATKPVAVRSIFD